MTENRALRKEQPDFKFNSQNLKKAENTIKMYPECKQASAVMSLLYLAQDQCGGWIPQSAMTYIADFLKIPHIQVYEVANFYTMYNLSPVGKYLIQVCRTTPCWLCGSGDILNTCKRVLEIDVGETTEDNLFTLKEVECLGACTAAPVVQINNDYYENLTPDKMEEIIKELSDN
ncbi:NADH-quinone oxidoreductase subunit NuoE [Candidatus Mesenet endosymbiont of Agriotes lineatus]|uniref:NADH-quinone oxidoreductase subunit NuoE n=1 Tax=Candidatus Mesenet endosymbiont of Agriotes lineatus TaxID=3077948 RepID=UPI0039775B7A